MAGSIRAAVLGMLAGAAASAPLALSLGHPRSSVALGMVIGIAHAVSTGRTPQAYVDNLMAAGALGVPLWGLISVVALPLLSGQRLEWSAEEMRTHFPALVVWALYGALLGLFTQALRDLAELLVGREAGSVAPVPREKIFTVQKALPLPAGGSLYYPEPRPSLPPKVSRRIVFNSATKAAVFCEPTVAD